MRQNGWLYPAYGEDGEFLGYTWISKPLNGAIPCFIEEVS